MQREAFSLTLNIFFSGTAHLAIPIAFVASTPRVRIIIDVPVEPLLEPDYGVGGMVRPNELPSCEGILGMGRVFVVKCQG